MSLKIYCLERDTAAVRSHKPNSLVRLIITDYSKIYCMYFICEVITDCGLPQMQRSEKMKLQNLDISKF